MKSRIESNAREISQDFSNAVLGKTKYDKMKDAAVNFGYIGERVTNGLIEVIAWNGAYREAMESGKSDAESIKIADHAVRQTLIDPSVAGSARVEGGDPFKRMFLMFYSYFGNQLNLLMSEAQLAKELGINTSKGSRKLLYAYTMIVMAPAILSELIQRAASGVGIDEDDDGEYIDDIISIFFSSQFRFMTAMVPFGTIANSFVNRFNDKPYDDKLNLSPAISAGESLLSGAHGLIVSITDEEKEFTAKTAKDLLHGIGLVTGLPLGAAAKPVKYGMDVSSGKVKPTGPVDFTRGLITGRPGQQ